MVVVIAFIVCSSDAATQNVNSATMFGRCANFTIQAGTALSFNGVGNQAVCGNVGVAPGVVIAGIPLLGANYNKEANTQVAVDCAADELIAYGYLTALKCTITLVNPDLSGMTLSPGIYCTSSGVFTLKTGTLTLDAQGDSTAQFLFLMATTLITSAHTNIIPVNSAQPNNIFWQVGSSATLGANSSFMGHILAQASITVGATVTITGRVYARAAISFAGDDIIHLPGLC
ncbi:unnamed protein product [Adineta steineri]|uniref:Ice-binding protein n=1 Tax=Adineta steineri TaxID=433720 RepID=A0A815C601_9BILA|nr:unnamed protein product [Adineta steineri]CAF1310859.1 unnamed protein product [Adineta steineri]CAF3614160.1 unnamed protein product [Adineta steineri]CAF3638185.1 unnamed protein product [Adineta steineri]